jgi:transposase
VRPAIVNGRRWGGNRTAVGARTQQVTISVIRTARQQNLDPLEVMINAQHSPTVSNLIALPARASPPPAALAA